MHLGLGWHMGLEWDKSVHRKVPNAWTLEVTNARKLVLGCPSKRWCNVTVALNVMLPVLIGRRGGRKVTKQGI